MAAGTWSGRILVFDIPAKGPNIVLNEELAGHQTPITDIATERAQGQVSPLLLPLLVAWEAHVWVLAMPLRGVALEPSVLS